MLSMIISFSISYLITSFIMNLASSISKKSFNDREKNSPFECGFDPKSSGRMPFSLRFFLIAIIFLIFDVEIVLLLPIIFMMKTTSLMAWSLSALGFIIILTMGLYHEWKQGALEWSN